MRGKVVRLVAGLGAVAVLAVAGLVRPARDAMVRWLVPVAGGDPIVHLGTEEEWREVAAGAQILETIYDASWAFPLVFVAVALAVFGLTWVAVRGRQVKRVSVVVLAAVLLVGTVAAPATAQDAELVSVECRVMDAEYALMDAWEAVDDARNEYWDTGYRRHQKEWGDALKALETDNEAGRTLREEFEHWLKALGKIKGWGTAEDNRWVVSSDNLKAARDACREGRL